MKLYLIERTKRQPRIPRQPLVDIHSIRVVARARKRGDVGIVCLVLDAEAWPNGRYLAVALDMRLRHGAQV